MNGWAGWEPTPDPAWIRFEVELRLLVFWAWLKGVIEMIRKVFEQLVAATVKACAAIAAAYAQLPPETRAALAAQARA